MRAMFQEATGVTNRKAGLENEGSNAAMKWRDVTKDSGGRDGKDETI